MISASPRSWARRVDDEAAGLRVLQEGGRQPGLEGIGRLDDRLRIVGDQDAEDALEEPQAASQASMAVSMVSRNTG
jgi:hypothetical protein